MRGTRFIAFTLITGFTALGVWWWTTRTRSAPRSAAVPVLRSPDDASTSAPVVDATSKSVVPKRASEFGATSGKHSSEASAQDDGSGHEEPKLAIEGVVVVVDGEGREHAGESGTFQQGSFEPKDDTDPEIASKSTAEWPGSMRYLDRVRSRDGTIAVEHGRFQVQASSKYEFGALDLRLGGRVAVVDSAPVKVALGQIVTIRAHWMDGVRVHVIDRATRVELDDVTVVRDKSEDGSVETDDCDPGDPATLDTIVEHGHSPVLVPPPKDESRTQGHVSIRARDHHWCGVLIDFDETSELTVELVASATLVVDVRGDLPSVAAAPMLRLRRPAGAKPFDEVVKEELAAHESAPPGDYPDGRKPSRDDFLRHIESMRSEYEAQTSTGVKFTERPAKVGETRFDGLVPRDLIASIEIGGEWGAPLVLASAPVSLVAGRTTSVTLVAARFEPAKPVPLAGTIFVPPSWNQLELVVWPLDLRGDVKANTKQIHSNEWEPIEGRAGWFHWDAGKLLPAKYMLKVNFTGIVEVVDLNAGGDSNVEIVVPEAAKLRVRVVDADGKPIRVGNLGWKPIRELETYFGWDWITIRYEPRLDSYSARVPVGPGQIVQVSTEDWMIDAESSRAVATAGEQELVLHVHRASGAEIEFHGDSIETSWTASNFEELRKMTVQRAEGPTSVSWQSKSPPGFSIRFNDGGHFTITFPTFEGFEPVAPLEIEVGPGETVKKTVEMKRSK